MFAFLHAGQNLAGGLPYKVSTDVPLLPREEGPLKKRRLR
jgi:hypothetical protein